MNGHTQEGIDAYGSLSEQEFAELKPWREYGDNRMEDDPFEYDPSKEFARSAQAALDAQNLPPPMEDPFAEE